MDLYLCSSAGTALSRSIAKVDLGIHGCGLAQVGPYATAPKPGPAEVTPVMVVGCAATDRARGACSAGSVALPHWYAVDAEVKRRRV
jgi:hypothetical protein